MKKDTFREILSLSATNDISEFLTLEKRKIQFVIIDIEGNQCFGRFPTFDDAFDFLNNETVDHRKKYTIKKVSHK